MAASLSGGHDSFVSSCTKLSRYRNTGRFNNTLRVIFGQGLGYAMPDSARLTGDVFPVKKHEKTAWQESPYQAKKY